MKMVTWFREWRRKRRYAYQRRMLRQQASLMCGIPID